MKIPIFLFQNPIFLYRSAPVLPYFYPLFPRKYLSKFTYLLLGLINSRQYLLTVIDFFAYHEMITSVFFKKKMIFSLNCTFCHFTFPHEVTPNYSTRAQFLFLTILFSNQPIRMILQNCGKTFTYLLCYFSCVFS